MTLNLALATILDIFLTPIALLIIAFQTLNLSIKKNLIWCIVLYPIFIIIIMLCNDYLGFQSIGFLIYFLFSILILSAKENKNLLLINQSLTLFFIFDNIRYLLNVPFYLANAYELNRNIVIIFVIYLVEIIGTLIIIKFIYKRFPMIDSFLLHDTSYTILLCVSHVLQNTFFFIQILQDKYKELVYYSFLFVLISLFYVCLLSIAQYRNMENMLNKEKFKQEITTLQKYSSLMNEKQNQLRKFRHDYKNLILTLSALIHENKIEEMKTYLQELNVYSQEQLELVHIPFNDLNTIQNSIIRGFIFSKLLEFEMNHLEFEFHCETTLEEINLDNFNLIRIIGIYLDNAIEHLMDHQNGNFSLYIEENAKAHFFTIKNTYLGDKLLIREIIQQGFTTKAGHSGQGLDTIEVLKQKCPQISVQYQVGEYFQVHLIIEKNKE